MPGTTKTLTAEHFLLTTLVVKVAIVAVLSTMLVRFPWFRRILLTEKRDWPERLIFAASLGLPLTAGVVARLLINYNAADLTLAGAFLAGLLAGPYAGAIVGSMVGIPAAHRGRMDRAALRDRLRVRGRRPPRDLSQGSDLALLAALLHGPAPERLAARAPVPDRLGRHPAGGADRPRDHPPGARVELQGARLLPRGRPTPWLRVLVVVATVLCVAIPIKIWNSARIEHRLQEQEKLLMAARVEALASQINPHFLFNTLTSISSLIRSQPETARMLIVKLSGLLRRLLRSQEHFVTLREELEAIDEYLDIESIRFGPKLRIEKSIDPDSLDVVVPSMLLQPLVENSIKHGLSPKIGEGRITIRSSRQSGEVLIDVIDNGVGVSPAHADRVKTGGIGLRNVNERLRVIYGANYQLQLDSVPGEGTCARIVIPELDRAGEDYGLTETWTSSSRFARSWSTTSSWRARSCAFCSGSSRASRSPGRRATASRRCASSKSTCPTS